MPQITIKPDQLAKLDFKKPVTLVADHGVYLITFGDKNSVAYAHGINPHVDEFDDWYSRKQYVMGGGDDEIIELGYITGNIDFSRSLKISIGKTKIGFSQ